MASEAESTRFRYRSSDSLRETFFWASSRWEFSNCS